MPKRTTDYRRTLLEDLKDPVEAQNYLSAALEDSEDMFLVALRDVAEAHQMAKVAGKVGVSRESLYRMLTASGNPRYRNFFGIMRALDITFTGVRSKSVRPHSQPPNSPVPGPTHGNSPSEPKTATSTNQATSPSIGKPAPKDINAPASSVIIRSIGPQVSGLVDEGINVQARGISVQPNEQQLVA